MHSLLLLVISADPSVLSRPEPAVMPHQALLELLVSELDDKNIFRISGRFIDISRWKGIELNENQEVTEICWYPKPSPFENPTRYVPKDPIELMKASRPSPKPGGSMDFKWLPSTVRKVGVYNLNLKGTINTLVLPRDLDREFTVEKNSFEGSFDTAGLPRRLWACDVSHNQLSGTLDFTSLPPRMRTFYVVDNCFSGTVNFYQLPEALWMMKLSENKFSGPIDLSVFRTQSVRYYWKEIRLTARKQSVYGQVYSDTKCCDSMRGISKRSLTLKVTSLNFTRWEMEAYKYELFKILVIKRNRKL